MFVSLRMRNANSSRLNCRQNKRLAVSSATTLAVGLRPTGKQCYYVEDMGYLAYIRSVDLFAWRARHNIRMLLPAVQRRRAKIPHENAVIYLLNPAECRQYNDIPRSKILMINLIHMLNAHISLHFVQNTFG